MARDRKIPSDFWTWEAVIDCAPMTRLLFIGLWNFADDFGVQPLRPRTIRMQVFPGDAIDNDAVRTMIDELATQGLVRIYEVDGVEYVAVVDWGQLQRVGKNARRRYPSAHGDMPCAGEAPARTMEIHSNAETAPTHAPPEAEPDRSGPTVIPSAARDPGPGLDPTLRSDDGLTRTTAP
ncbi:MAG: hypothetical protein KF889_09565 [Alphaproteobacteria bacterium]|nr:hypothetical protein [Alphaproteobacteria bacterium]MCW5741070.1 hypothetical protein [Alphaproteobacteria bacterium]